MFEFKRGDVVRWARATLERGRQVNAAWYEDQKDAVGVVHWIQRDGDVLVAWRKSGGDTCVHPADRLELVSACEPGERLTFRSNYGAPRTGVVADASDWLLVGVLADGSSYPIYVARESVLSSEGHP